MIEKSVEYEEDFDDYISDNEESNKNYKNAKLVGLIFLILKTTFLSFIFRKITFIN